MELQGDNWTERMVLMEILKQEYTLFWLLMRLYHACKYIMICTYAWMFLWLEGTSLGLVFHCMPLWLEPAAGRDTRPIQSDTGKVNQLNDSIQNSCFIFICLSKSDWRGLQTFLSLVTCIKSSRRIPRCSQSRDDVISPACHGSAPESI